MKHLHNTISRTVLREQLKQEAFSRIPVSFYKYVEIPQPQDFRDHLYLTWQPLLVFGRIYVANEGINAQLSIPEHKIADFKKSVQDIPQLKGVFLNQSSDQGDEAFIKLDVKVRRQIVADGLDENLFTKQNPGTPLDPIDFHNKLKDNDTIVVDVRNDYECETGHFKNSIVPKSKYFREVLPELKDELRNHQDKNILLYCTGGIRCEKASAYFKDEGYKNVFQLQGGIINYLRKVKKQGLQPQYEGSLFVFDGRMAESSAGEKIGKCYSCGNTHDIHIDCANVLCHKLIIQCDECAEKYQGYCSEACKDYVEKHADTKQ